MDKLKLHSPDFTQENIERLAELFPNCVTETRRADGSLKKAIDFDQLRQELSADTVEGPQERYQLNWPGKREALATSNAPINKTLRPCREESVDFDTTQNLFIEGDNLDALKLLQETYLGKVKMIYIDPPYNTGNDFIYNDRFTAEDEQYQQNAGLRDEERNRLLHSEQYQKNQDSNGRFHSDWLSMMYPRLKLARNLLRDDGVIFISIDDNESDNLQKICEEIFSENNVLGRLVWKNATDNNPTRIAVEHEYVLVCCKDKISVDSVWKSSISDVKDLLVSKSKELLSIYSDESDLKNAYTLWFREHKSQLWPLDGYKFIDHAGIYAGIRGVHNPGKEGYRYDVLHPVTGKPCTQPLMGYRFPKDTMDKLIEKGRIIFGDDHTKLIELKSYAHDYQEKLSSLIEIDGRSGAYDVRSLFPEFRTAFENPKPVKFLQRFIPLILKSDGDIFLDFFAGSCSSAHALMELNAKDSQFRRFIMIQIPEPCGEKSEPFKKGIKVISELSKERIRRAGQKIKADNADKEGIDELDIGFRVLKIDSSNIKDVFARPDAFAQGDLESLVDNIRADRTVEDLLFQVLLDWGVDLTLPVTEVSVTGKKVLFVDGNALAACFETGIDEAFVKQLAELHPLRAVFRDSGFASDSVKINVAQLFKQLSPHTEIKVI
ncbi:MAG: site-specific DNA-methyltransferase [Gammaproteobacteria bacterium]|nr:site-specific DNA-methyltransferase [Gammaproteobacteria bacterium]